MGVSVLTTVVTPAANYDLTTLAVVKDDLTITNGMSDAYLSRTISRVSAVIARYCNRVFLPEFVLDEFYIDRDAYPFQFVGGVRTLQTARWPVIPASLIAPMIPAPVVTENGATLVDGTDYRIAYASGLLTRLDGSGTPMNWGEIPTTVKYWGGYQPVPADLEEACARFVRARYTSRSRDPTLRSEDISGVYRADYQVAGSGSIMSLPPDIAAVVDIYRVPVIA